MRLALLILLVLTSPAFAHKLLIKMTMAAPNVKLEAYYEDESPSQQAKVAIYDGETLVLEGRTDDTGVWVFPMPAPGTYSVRVVDLGHSARGTLIVPEVLPVVVEETARQSGTKWRKLTIGLGIIAFVVLFPMLWRKTRGR